MSFSGGAGCLLAGSLFDSLTGGRIGRLGGGAGDLGLDWSSCFGEMGFMLSIFGAGFWMGLIVEVGPPVGGLELGFLGMICGGRDAPSIFGESFLKIDLAFSSRDFLG